MLKERLAKKTLVVSLICLALSAAAAAQTAPASIRPGFSIYAGGIVSGFKPHPGSSDILPGFPDGNMIGLGAFVDFDSRRWWGIEGEARWLPFRGSNRITESTFLAGPRVFYSFGRFKVTGKALYGQAIFDFPPGYGNELDPALEVGGGVDYRLTHKLTVRLIEADYQKWFNFQNTGITPVGVSIGVAYKLR